MAIFAEVTENEHIIQRHLRDIHPLLDYDASERQYALRFIEIGLSGPYGFSMVTLSQVCALLTLISILCSSRTVSLR